MTIKEMSKEIKLGYLFNNHEEINVECKQLKWSCEEYLQTILEREIESRKNNGINRRIRDAKFPYKKYLEDLIKEKYSREIAEEIIDLEKLDFINKKENIILIGSPGSGKTHLAIGIGIKACMKGLNVIFTSVPNLIIELKEAMSHNNLTNYKKKFMTYDLVILDELGYISFDKSGCEILFNLLSNRTYNGSIIITTNLTFDRWDEVFKDPMLTGALVDRLAHKAHLLNISTEISYRLEETQKWKENSKKEQ